MGKFQGPNTPPQVFFYHCGGSCLNLVRTESYKMEDKEDTKKRAPCAEKLTDGCSENSKDRKREREREVNRVQFVQRASQNTCVDGL